MGHWELEITQGVVDVYYPVENSNDGKEDIIFSWKREENYMKYFKYDEQEAKALADSKG